MPACECVRVRVCINKFKLAIYHNTRIHSRTHMCMYVCVYLFINKIAS